MFMTIAFLWGNQLYEVNNAVARAQPNRDHGHGSNGAGKPKRTEGQY